MFGNKIQLDSIEKSNQICFQISFTSLINQSRCYLSEYFQIIFVACMKLSRKPVLIRIRLSCSIERFVYFKFKTV